MTEREALLNVAIDEQLVSFLLQCVSEFSEGRFTNLGCSLPALLEWTWSRVCSIKATNDSLCKFYLFILFYFILFYFILFLFIYTLTGYIGICLYVRSFVRTCPNGVTALQT